MAEHKAYIIDALRVPFGKYKGFLSGIRPDDLIALNINGLLQRNDSYYTENIESCILGDGNQAGEDCRNIARMGVLLSQLPQHVPAFSINSLCGSGMQAVIEGVKAILTSEVNNCIVGGVESMSRAPLVQLKSAFNTDNKVFDSTIGWRFTNPNLAQQFGAFSMGELAAQTALEYNISKTQQDEFTFNSYEKYTQAYDCNLYNDELMVIQTEDTQVNIDEQVNNYAHSLEKIAKSKSHFTPLEAGVSKANTSTLSDGAATILLSNLPSHKHRIYVKNWVTVGVHPNQMALASAIAIQKLLTKCNLQLSDVQLFELNEAFASTTLACTQYLQIPQQNINIRGGSLAIGNPVGVSGARLIGSLFYNMLQTNSRYGIASISVGLGLGLAVLLHNENA